VRNPNKATTRVSINRPNTYERLPRTCQKIICEQQPVHTKGPFQDVEETAQWNARHNDRLAGRRNADAIAMPAE
jgi:hypothetical protein